jgi:(R,R)-butanediol dehydrogenase/meso-butanediol dehydrogenase/diacetyl reductase
VIGHEFGGTVVAVGESVVGVKVGDRVGVDPTLSCGECYFCQRGTRTCASAGRDRRRQGAGGFAERVAVPERCVYPVPDGCRSRRRP